MFKGCINCSCWLHLFASKLYLVFMLLTVDLFLQSYPGAENSTALATPQGFHSVSDIKLIYVAVIVGL